jgi:hypothetical protein
MAKREKEGKVHMHEYDDNWQCRCGFRLITDSQAGGAVVNIKAFVTADGQTVALHHGKEDAIEREEETDMDTETEIETETESEEDTKSSRRKKSAD